MRQENQKNTPKEIGVVALNDNSTMRYVIGPNEDSNSKRGNLEKKFLSEWFGGEYEIGYSTDPLNPTADAKKFKFKITGSKTKLKRGCVYAAVKYDGQWRAARIIKSE